MGTGVELVAPEILAAEAGSAVIGASAGAATAGAAAGSALAAGTGLAAGAAGGLTAAGLSGAALGAGLAGGVTAAGVLSNLKTAATIASPIVGLAQAASGIKAAKIGRSITAPTVTPPTAMPVFGSGNQLNALRADIQEQLMRRGRAASILTAEAPGGERFGS